MSRRHRNRRRGESRIDAAELSAWANSVRDHIIDAARQAMGGDFSPEIEQRFRAVLTGHDTAPASAESAHG